MSNNTNNTNQPKKTFPPIFCKSCGQIVGKHTLKCPKCNHDIVKVTDVIIKDKK